MIGGPLPPEDAQRTAVQALWTFPSILISAFIVAWGAETAQFFISQGLALALLAWVQVLPEFAVEAVIAWHRDVPLMTANFTGALRLLTGLGWPMIWIVFAASRWQRERRGFFSAIQLEEEHAAEIVGMTPPILYFGWVIYKGTLDCWDSGVLLALYLGYLVLLNRIPPREHEDVEDVAAVPRSILALAPPWRVLGVIGLLLAGGAILFFAAEPFLSSMVGLATVLGVSQFVFVQWVAPFLSEFPEFVSTAYWARRRGKGGMALMNMVSSNINQWTVLAAMIPIVFSLSIGHPAAVPMQEHRTELLLTLLQSALGVVILSNLDFHAYEALGLFVLWFAQFLVPGWREEISIVYAVWLVVEISSAAWRPGRLRAFRLLPSLWNMGASKPRR
jgi:cation:H+ antiporter